MDRMPTRRQNEPSDEDSGADASLPKIGDVLAGQYEVFEINEGGFGYVLGVTDTCSGKKLAVKTPKDTVSDASAREFADEVALWVQLDPHPNIVTAQFVREIRGLPALFMEYVPAAPYRTLRELLNAERVSHERAINFIYQICSAMDYAYRHRELVHMDIKPENILVQDGTTLKITDFGLSHRVRVVDGAYARRSAGSWLYAAPERFRGEPCDTRSDMYSVGVLLYEMLTTTYPYPQPLPTDPRLFYESLRGFHAADGMYSIVNSLYWSGLDGVGHDINAVLSTFLHPHRGERFIHFGRATSILGDIGAGDSPLPAARTVAPEPLARIAALQAVGEHSTALSMLNKLLVEEPTNAAYYLAAARSLDAIGQGWTATTFRERARTLTSPEN